MLKVSGPRDDKIAVGLGVQGSGFRVQGCSGFRV